MKKTLHNPNIILESIKTLLDELHVAIQLNNHLLKENKRMNDRVVDGICLENKQRRKSFEGSNPSSSAILPYVLPLQGSIRMKDVLKIVPVGRSTWLEGVKSGRFPKPFKIGKKINAWKVEDIRHLIKNNSIESNDIT